MYFYAHKCVPLKKAQVRAVRAATTLFCNLVLWIQSTSPVYEREKAWWHCSERTTCPAHRPISIDRCYTSAITVRAISSLTQYDIKSKGQIPWQNYKHLWCCHLTIVLFFTHGASLLNLYSILYLTQRFCISSIMFCMVLLGSTEPAISSRIKRNKKLITAIWDLLCAWFLNLRANICEERVGPPGQDKSIYYDPLTFTFGMWTSSSWPAHTVALPSTICSFKSVIRFL